MPSIHETMLVTGSLPNAYQEVLYWKMTENPSRRLLAQALAFVSLFIFGLMFASLAIGLGKLPMSGSFSLGLNEIGAVFIGTVLTLVAHELTHGVVMRLSGAKPSYGIFWKGIMLYATSPGHAYQRNTYVVILLTPFVFISALVVLGIWFLPVSQWILLLVICGVVNASGAIGDLWMTLITLRYPTTAFIMDERDRLRVFSSTH
jgi:Putative zincin peptidase